MRHLLERDLLKLSTLSEIPVEHLQKLHDMGVLNEKRAIDHLIRHDFRHINRRRIYTVAQITAAIMAEYEVSKATVHNAIYEKKKKVWLCKECGRETRKSELARNHGVCDPCRIKAIKI